MNRMPKMLLLLAMGLGLLASKCKKDETGIANFDFAVSGNTVVFTSTSTENPESLTWNFGDGTGGTGTEISHTYAEAGTYDVELQAHYKNGHTTATHQVTIEALEKIAKISTAEGDMYIYLYSGTPLHKANFIKLAESGYFNGTTFHRVVRNFVIQGGDPLSKDSDPNNDGTGGPGYTIPAEINTAKYRHKFGALGAARLADGVNPQKASSGSQFYIVVNPQGTGNLDGQYTVFGEVIKGMDIAKKIEDKEVVGNTQRPKIDVTMQVTIEEKTRARILSEFGYTVTD